MKNIWISPAEIAQLPMSGPAWTAVKAAADSAVGAINLSDQDDIDDVRTYARALVFVRTGSESYRQKVISSIMACLGSENGGRVLALSRNLPAIVIAADLAGLPPDDDIKFRTWLAAVRNETLDSNTLISIHKRRPNNWGTQAGFARACAALYLDDAADLADTLKVFKGWLGDRSSYAGFEYGDLAWQCDPSKAVGINPKGCQIQGHPMDGGLPEELRRASGSFVWPPPKENYVYTALEGALSQAWVLRHADPKIFEASNSAILRAYKWLYEVCKFPAVGNDTWQPLLVRAIYGPVIPTTSAPAQVGKSIGYTDWTHASTVIVPTPLPDDKIANYNFHWDAANNFWLCHRTDANEVASGAGSTSHNALAHWLTLNASAP